MKEFTAKDFRIGNIVSYRSKIEYDIFQCKIESIADYGIELFADPYLEAGILIHDIIPVDITNEWLVKFGFINDYGKVYCMLYADDKYKISKSIDTWRFFITYEGYDIDVHLKRIQYVHELQNIMYELTGIELNCEI